MFEMLRILSILSAFIVGLLAKPVQEWVTYLLSAKERKKELRLIAIKKAFHLASHLREYPKYLNSVVNYFTLYERCEKLKIDNISLNLAEVLPYPDENKLNHLKYLLIYELAAPDDFLQIIDDIEQATLNAAQLCLFPIVKDVFYANTDSSRLDAMLKRFGKNTSKGACAYSTQIEEELDKKVEALILDIHLFLKKLKLDGKN